MPRQTQEYATRQRSHRTAECNVSQVDEQREENLARFIKLGDEVELCLDTIDQVLEDNAI